MITKTDYNWLPIPANAKNLVQGLSDRGYSAPIDLGGPARLFGRDQRYISIGPHSMINLLQSRGQNLEYKGRPKQLPSGVVNPDDGYLFVPFGEQMFMRTCGTHAKLWTLPDRAVISVVAKHAFTKDMVIFQIHFLYNTEIIEVHYKRALTGNQTVIGICGEPGEYSDWGCNRYEELGGTAIQIDTRIQGEEEPADVKPFPPSSPFPPSNPNPPADVPPSSDDWVQAWINNDGDVKVMEKVK
ncbi:MAG: hypothetical protein U9N61_05590 [Euryarchaeota archaeon]|nr:hypothetical protein [Euryarchaeota archaeon]